MKRALISVSDKTGIIEFAKELSEQGYEIISTGGTKKLLMKQDLKHFLFLKLLIFLK